MTHDRRIAALAALAHVAGQPARALLYCGHVQARPEPLQTMLLFEAGEPGQHARGRVGAELGGET